jgi:hypothetical protein
MEWQVDYAGQPSGHEEFYGKVFEEKSELSLNSLILPLFFRYNNIGSGSNRMFYIEAGPIVGYYFGEYRYDYSIIYIYKGETNLVKRSKIKMRDLCTGYGLGAGMEFYMNSRQAAWLGVRYRNVSNGLMDKEDSFPYVMHTVELVAAFSLFNF